MLSGQRLIAFHAASSRLASTRSIVPRRFNSRTKKTPSTCKFIGGCRDSGSLRMDNSYRKCSGLLRSVSGSLGLSDHNRMATFAPVVQQARRASDSYCAIASRIRTPSGIRHARRIRTPGRSPSSRSTSARVVCSSTTCTSYHRLSHHAQLNNTPLLLLLQISSPFLDIDVVPRQ